MADTPLVGGSHRSGDLLGPRRRAEAGRCQDLCRIRREPRAGRAGAAARHEAPQDLCERGALRDVLADLRSGEIRAMDRIVTRVVLSECACTEKAEEVESEDERDWRDLSRPHSVSLRGST